jgi:hypothetical protein
MAPMLTRLICLIVLLAGILVAQACAGVGDKSDGSSSGADSPAIARPESPKAYVPTDSAPASGWGSLSIAVTVSDDSLRDTTVFPIRDFDSCGSQLTDNSIQREGRMLSGAIAWLPSVTEGKQLPVRKRFDIEHRGCLLSPRVQAATIGGTLNVRNYDGALHVLRFSDTRTGDTLARITQSEPGQVVPIDYILDVARVIEVTCETHPWTKAWIHVFNQPYYVITGRSGTALMDSIPAGSHQLFVWHERFGEQRSDVSISAGASQTVGVELGRAAGSRGR